MKKTSEMFKSFKRTFKLKQYGSNKRPLFNKKKRFFLISFDFQFFFVSFQLKFHFCLDLNDFFVLFSISIFVFGFFFSNSLSCSVAHSRFSTDFFSYLLLWCVCFFAHFVCLYFYSSQIGAGDFFVVVAIHSCFRSLTASFALDHCFAFWFFDNQQITGRNSVSISNT